MASLVTNYGQDYFANVLFGASHTVPTTWYLALLTQTPDASADGTMLSEPSGGGYARKSVANDATHWNASAGGIVTNAVDLSYGIASADWVDPITDYAFCDAATAGSVYLTGTLRVPRLVHQGDMVVFSARLLAVSISGITQTIVGT